MLFTVVNTKFIDYSRHDALPHCFTTWFTPSVSLLRNVSHRTYRLIYRTLYHYYYMKYLVLSLLNLFSLRFRSFSILEWLIIITYPSKLQSVAGCKPLLRRLVGLVTTTTQSGWYRVCFKLSFSIQCWCSSMFALLNVPNLSPHKP